MSWHSLLAGSLIQGPAVSAGTLPAQCDIANGSDSKQGPDGASSPIASASASFSGMLRSIFGQRSKAESDKSNVSIVPSKEASNGADSSPTSSHAQQSDLAAATSTASSLDVGLPTPGSGPGGLPVQFESYSKEYTQMSSQDNFDGFRLEAGKAVNKYLQMNHSLFLGTALRESGYLYQFGPTLALDDDSAFLVARYSNDNTVTLRSMKRFPKWGTELRFSGQSCLENEQRNVLELAVDQQGFDWAAAVKACWQGAWILNSTFSQVLSRHLQMGGDLTWVANGSTMGTVGLRYNIGDHIFSAALSRQPNFKSRDGMLFNSHGCKMQYFRKVSERLHLGAELELSVEPSSASTAKESALRLAYEYFFRQARVQGLIDSGGKVSLLAQDSSGFGISGMIDYWKGDYRFGFMMQLLPPVTEEAQDSASSPGMQPLSATP